MFLSSICLQRKEEKEVQAVLLNHCIEKFKDSPEIIITKRLFIFESDVFIFILLGRKNIELPGSGPDAYLTY